MNTAPSSVPSDLISVLEAMDEEEQDNHMVDDEGREDEVKRGEIKEGEDKATTHNRKLPDWMRDPHEVAEEQVQHALLLQAKKVINIFIYMKYKV